ncbi:MAG: toxin-activating lysine-acyltransferase [Halofilum sp. (in: g-proteobacteria)]|nr:toxin-activating lysine-acyltransferase [Halofilum sp. (in: g-proteobacteria)]
MSARKRDEQVSAAAAPEQEDAEANTSAKGEESPPGDSAPRKTVATALGEIAWLLSQSPSHRHSLFIGDLEWLVIPPLTLGQYRLFYSEGKPVGAAFWAFLSETVEQRLAGGGRLGANEWRSGDRVWLVELVAPFGGQDRMLEDLRKTALDGRVFRYVRVQPGGRRETVEVTDDGAA